MIDDIYGLFFSISKAHALIVVIILATYIIEKLTGLSLFVDQFRWEKSTRNAEIHLDGDSVYYFVFNGIVFGYDVYKGNVNFSFITIGVWLVIMIFLTMIFRTYYDRYQGVDLNKTDDDYS